MGLQWVSQTQKTPPPSEAQMHNETEGFFDHEIHHYHFAHLFEFSVEVINTGAGMMVIFALCLGFINLFIVGYNAATDKELMLINPLHSGHNRVATVVAIRLMLGELTALALAVLVAADVVDTVIKPTHAYEMNVVIKMGFITVLRTGLAYFLAREIKEQEEVHHNIVRSKSVMGLERMGALNTSGSFGGVYGTAHTGSGKPSPPGSEIGLSPVDSASNLACLSSTKKHE